MRGRKPLRLKVRSADIPRLQEIAHGLCLPWYQVRRARIVLARWRCERPQRIALYMQCSARTVRRTCIRYEHLGLRGLLVLADRPGRPAQITPLQRAEIVRLACLEPIAKGLHITHWASADLARETVAEG